MRARKFASEIYWPLDTVLKEMLLELIEFRLWGNTSISKYLKGVQLIEFLLWRNAFRFELRLQYSLYLNVLLHPRRPAEAAMFQPLTPYRIKSWRSSEETLSAIHSFKSVSRCSTPCQNLTIKVTFLCQNHPNLSDFFLNYCRVA